MNPDESLALKTARWLAFLSSAVIVVGIAPSQIFLGAALVALFLSKEKLQLPRIKWTLALFLAGTLLAVLLSGHPKAGWPQVKKIYVFSQLLVVYSLLRSTQLARWLIMTTSIAMWMRQVTGLPVDFNFNRGHMRMNVTRGLAMRLA